MFFLRQNREVSTRYLLRMYQVRHFPYRSGRNDIFGLDCWKSEGSLLKWGTLTLIFPKSFMGCHLLQWPPFDVEYPQCYQDGTNVQWCLFVQPKCLCVGHPQELHRWKKCFWGAQSCFNYSRHVWQCHILPARSIVLVHHLKRCCVRQCRKPNTVSWQWQGRNKM